MFYIFVVFLYLHLQNVAITLGGCCSYTCGLLHLQIVANGSSEKISDGDDAYTSSKKATIDEGATFKQDFGRGSKGA